MQGLSLGSLVKTTSVLKYQKMNTQDTGLDNSTTKKSSLAILRLITQERWQPDMSSETTATRSQCNLQTQFANFASYVLPLMQDCKYSYILLYSIWCEYCGQYMSVLRGEASSTPSRFNDCNVCKYGDFDLCTSRYDKGETCKVPSHTLK